MQIQICVNKYATDGFSHLKQGASLVPVSKAWFAIVEPQGRSPLSGPSNSHGSFERMQDCDLASAGMDIPDTVALLETAKVLPQLFFRRPSGNTVQEMQPRHRTELRRFVR